MGIQGLSCISLISGKLLRLNAVIFFYLLAFLSSSFSYAQTTLNLDKDTLSKSLEHILEGKSLALKKQHFLYDANYDYYSVINSPWIINEISDILGKIDSPYSANELKKITFVKCHDWTEAYNTWYVTLIDKEDNCALFFYRNNQRTEKIKLHNLSKGTNYTFDLAKHVLASSMSCAEKNEDYIVIAEIVGSRFVSFTSSQIFHRMDMFFFNNLLAALKA